MKIPKEIAGKVSDYQELRKKENTLYEEIKEWFEENTDLEGFYDPFITNKPTGEKQFDGEYCDQITLGEDWYKGTYYYPIENSKQYVGLEFEI